MWFTSSPYNLGQEFNNILETSNDIALSGSNDYAFVEDEVLGVEKITNSEKIKMTCPLYRYMNTQDYKDVKTEIYNNYDVCGIYYQRDAAGKITEVYGAGSAMSIEILDGARWLAGGVVCLVSLLSLV